jgi:hypothetical protein
MMVADQETPGRSLPVRLTQSVAAILLTASITFGQSATNKTVPASAKELTGGVTGHVLCGDTNLPARFASVLLQPVYEAIPVKSKSTSGADENQDTPSVSISQTMLDGSYSISGVKPGRYYVIVEKMGYLSPLSQLTREQLNKPDDTSAAIISRLLAPVTITANHVATADVRILRGATITGSIRFDDGSPNGGGNISLMRKGRAGKWEKFRAGLVLAIFNNLAVDDEGRYRMTGLPAGEYLVKAEIDVRELKINNIFSEFHGSSINESYSLSIYSGGALRTRDAKPIKLQEGEAADLVDIEIPVSKMHTVTGSVTDASGRPINAAKVSLLYPDDNTELASTKVEKDDPEFHFFFVPEGDYTLKVTEARDVSREEVMYPPGTMPPSFTKETTVREYTESQQPISVKGEMSGVAAIVKAKDVKLTTSASQ